MSNRLALFLGSFEQEDSALKSLLVEWADAELLHSLAWLDVTASTPSPTVSYVQNSEVITKDLFDLLSSKIWDSVTIVATRVGRVDALNPDRFDRELKLLADVRMAFSSHGKLKLRAITVSIVESEGIVAAAFNPAWDSHLLQEPMIRIDSAVAAQPLRDDMRAPLIGLLAVTASGAFRWQAAPLLDTVQDATTGNYKPLRVARSYLRVVNAGRLTDEVLAGAFPASGPWSVPPEATNARAVPPDTHVPEALVIEVSRQGKFLYTAWMPPAREKPKNVSILEGIKLFFKEFVDALISIPKSVIETMKVEAQQWIQNATFGKDSNIALKFNPNNPDLDFDEVAEAIRAMKLGDTVDAVGESRPWELLQQTALGLVDAGRFPSDVSVPKNGTNRLVFTEPSSIGPSPAYAPFVLSEVEKGLLGIQGADGDAIQAMELDRVRSLTLRIEHATANGIGDGETNDVQNAATNADDVVQLSAMMGKDAADSALGKNKGAQSDKSDDESRSFSPFGFLLRRRRKKKAKKRAKKQEKLAKKQEKILKKTAKKNEKQKAKQAAKASEGSSTTESSSANDENKSDGSEGTALSETMGETEETTVVAADEESKDQIDVDPVNVTAPTDIHKPSDPSFSPDNYEYVTSFYQGQNPSLIKEFEAENAVHSATLSSYTSISGTWSQRQQCDHCGTRFDHGVVYLYKPDQTLVHVGHQCAQKAFGALNENSFAISRFSDLVNRWDAWIAGQENSYLYRIGKNIVDGLAAADQELVAAFEYLATQPKLIDPQSKAKMKFRKWTRRGLFLFVLLIAGAIASIVLTPLPLLIFAAVLALYGFGFVARLGFLARDLVRARHRLAQMMTSYDHAFERGRNAANEVVRLASVYEQFTDWQQVIREVVHVPFGREIAFSSGKTGIQEVTRPPSFVLGLAQPDDQQKMRLYLNARSQTIHAGWLTEIMDLLKSEWINDYQNARLTGPGDNIQPEADNAPSKSVVGKRPLSDLDVYYPRTDFRVHVLDGELQKKLVERKSQQIAADLARTPIDSLLGNVDVPGLGSALSGLSVKDFLAGLSSTDVASVPFTPDIFSERHPEFRVSFPEVVLPRPEEMVDPLGHLQVEPGTEFTVASWRVELSAAVSPIEAFAGYQETPLVDQSPLENNGGVIA